jgi:hypothetical protein
VSAPTAQPWFAEEPGEFWLFRVNRRPLPEGNLFATDGIPDDFFDHLRRVLAPGYEVVTGRRRQRVWKIGGSQVDEETAVLTGKLGWKPKGDAIVPDWSEEEQDWVASVTDPQGGQIAPFGVDGESRILAVLSDRSSAPMTISRVFEKILQENETELLERTTEWSVEPILDSREFIDWLAAQEVVTSVSFTAKLPNPEPSDAFRDLAERMRNRRARSHTETMKSEDDVGLTGVEEDVDFSQAIAMGERGFATLRGRGVRSGQKSRYSQTEVVARESVDQLPATWDAIRALIGEALKSRFRRGDDDSGAGSA